MLFAFGRVFRNCWDVKNESPKRFVFYSIFSPDHLIHNRHIRLNDLYNLTRHVLVGVIGHGHTVIAVFIHRNGGIDCLQKAVFINAGQIVYCIILGKKVNRNYYNNSLLSM